MIFSLSHSMPLPNPLLINNSPIDCVSSFRYLGVTLSSKLSWSTHVLSIINKARKLIGIIYRHFYRSCSPSTRLSLYLSIVRPVLEYCCSVWDPSPTYSSMLESVQFFALKVISKSWNSSYASLLIQFKISPLSVRRLRYKLLCLFKLRHNLLFIPSSPIAPFLPNHTYSLRSTAHHLHNLTPIASNLSLHSNSFFPSTILLWNSLPPPAKTTLFISEFK